MDKLILVFYIGENSQLDFNDMSQFISDIKSYLGDDYKPIFMLTKGESRVECINPKFIRSEDEIYNETMMKIAKVNDYYEEMMTKLTNND